MIYNEASVFTHSILPCLILILLFDNAVLVRAKDIRKADPPTYTSYLFRFRPVVDVYRRKVHDNVLWYSSASFVLISFSNSASAVSLSFYLSNDWFCDVHAHYRFYNPSSLTLLPSRTIIRSFRFGFKSFSGLIISFNHSHLNYRFVVLYC